MLFNSEEEGKKNAERLTDRVHSDLTFNGQIHFDYLTIKIHETKTKLKASLIEEKMQSRLHRHGRKKKTRTDLLSIWKRQVKNWLS